MLENFQLDYNSTLNAFEQVPQILLSNIILEKIISNIFTSNIGRNEYYLGTIYVFQKYRNKGYGSKLVEKAKQKARLNNARHLLLDVNNEDNNLMEYFKKFGFKKSANNIFTILGKSIGTYGLICELYGE